MANRDTFALSYHVVCLLDILGQKQRLAGWSEPPVDGKLAPAQLQALKQTVGVVRGLQDHFETFFEQANRCTMPEEVARLSEAERETYRRYRECHLCIQQFSDTFVFYAPVPNVHGDLSVIPLYRMIGASCVAMLVSLGARTPVRGAIVLGTGIELSDRNFYGPALVEAHHFESEVAEYPRITVSPKIDEFLSVVAKRTEGGFVGDRMRVMAAECSSLLGTDEDDHRIVDYMGKGVRRLLGERNEMSQTVRSAYEFSCDEANRFRVAGNDKLARRYEKLRSYIEPRLEIWRDPDADCGKGSCTMSDTDQPESFEQARTGQPDVSPDVSVFWKPLRRLFEDGNPTDPVTAIYYDVDNGRRLPFATIAKTKGDRLILWPPSDAREPGEFADGRTFSIHHATLELSNGRTHFTRFDASGQRIHEDHEWRLVDFDGGVKLWMIGAFRISYLENQVGALEQDVRMPNTDSERRVEEFRRYCSQMTHVAVNAPPAQGDCYVTVIHLLPDSASFRGPVKPGHFPMGSFWNDWIDGWPDGDNFQIVPTGINVGGVNLLLLTAAPLGRLRGECFLGGSS